MKLAVKERRGLLRLGVAALLAPLLLLQSSTANAADEIELVRLIRTHSAYKVRLGAIRVLTKHLIAQRSRPSDDAISALTAAANRDESRIVRGLAVDSLADLGDQRGLGAIERAVQDPEEFVRKRAEAALKRFPHGPASYGEKMLIVSLEERPQFDLPEGLYDHFGTTLVRSAQAMVGEGYRVVTGGDGEGYRLHSGIAHRELRRAGAGMEVEFAVRITVMTAPGNHLRHVVTSKAKAALPSGDPDSVRRLEDRVLAAAVERAVRDALAEISRS